MDLKSLKSDLLLVFTATIWGFAFVAQRVGMDYIGPFLYNGIRFALGSISLIPLIFLFKNSEPKEFIAPKKLLWAGVVAGAALFLGSSLQQVGVVYTTAGKAGFITGLYVVLVPIIGIFIKQKAHKTTWMGTIFAAAGLYFLTITGKFTISLGDFLVFVSAIFWAIHVQLIAHLAKHCNSLKLSALQFATCSILSLAVAFVFETIALSSILDATIPILYGGFLSVGVAYTLQVIAQKNAPPAHAAIILSMEGIFAVIGGYFILNETLSSRGLWGCALMFAGMLLSQTNVIFGKKRN